MNKLGYWVVVLTHKDSVSGKEVETKRVTSNENVVSQMFDDSFRDNNIVAIKVFKPKRGKNG